MEKGRQAGCRALCQDPTPSLLSVPPAQFQPHLKGILLVFPLGSSPHPAICPDRASRFQAEPFQKLSSLLPTLTFAIPGRKKQGACLPLHK